MIVVVRGADQRNPFVQSQLAGDMARRACAAVEIAQIEQPGRVALHHADIGRQLLQQRADQRRAERGIVPGDEPGVDVFDVEAHVRHGGPQRASIDICGYLLVCLTAEKRSSSLLKSRRGPLRVTSTSATPELWMPAAETPAR